MVCCAASSRASAMTMRTCAKPRTSSRGGCTAIIGTACAAVAGSAGNC